MFRPFVFCFALMCITGLAGFGQASAIRDYVGMISQTFHPDVVSYMENFKNELDRRGHSDAARSVDTYLKGESGTGFVYVSDDGTNYILTNFHVISQAHTLSISFEKPDGERTRFSDLTIVAADEDMDIALLAFAGGQNPFSEGLVFLDRPVEEGEDVFSAGFPGLGTAMVWQLGRGMISNASVRIPAEDDSEKMFGPFIQHTAQIDPGNSGGPLLVQSPGVPTGFAVAGINTRSARQRQAANFSIPLSRVKSFLDASLGPPAGDGLERLNTRIASFIQGLDSSKSVVPHISVYLSNACTGENAEFALAEIFQKAPRNIQDGIVHVFILSPVDGMSYAVAWTIENALKPTGRAASRNSGRISVTLNSVTAIDDNRYIVSFNVNNTTIDSEWVNEYGIWRIRTFGDFAAGDKSLVERRRQERIDAERLVIAPVARVSAGMAYIFDHGPAFGGDLKLSNNKYVTYGLQGYFGNDYRQVDFTLGFNIPIKAGKTAVIPFADFGIGLMFFPTVKNPDDFWGSDFKFDWEFGASIKSGLMFTTTFVPGLYLQAAYQHNFHKLNDEKINPHMMIFGIGYSR